MRRTGLCRDEQGASAIEFALAAPAMLMFIIGIAQLGMLCMADAGLRSAVAEGARAAANYPTPEDDAIIARIEGAAWGMQDARITEPEIVRDEDGQYIDISMSYSAPLNFAFFELPPVTLTEVRRVYTQSELTGSSSSGGGSSTTSASSTGGTSTSASSTSASSTSTSSTGGTSTSTGSTSTGSTSTGSTSTGSTSTGSTSTTSSTSTSTSSGNGSSGNNNGSSGNNNGSSGHNHGGSSGNGSSGN